MNTNGMFISDTNAGRRTRSALTAICLGVWTLAALAGAQVNHVLDDGSAERAVIVIAGTEPRPTLWLNAFDAQPGGEVITSISVTWGCTGGCSSGVPPQAPTTLYLYQDDPSNDGDPRTSTLLVSQVLDHGAPLGSIDTGVFLEVPIPPTAVTGTFFVAALYADPGVGRPAPVDTTDPDLLGKSWVFSAAYDAVNVVNLDDPLNFGGRIEDPPWGVPGNWLLRATGRASGCPGDLNGDRAVDLADLAVLLANFGASGATREMGDLNGDGLVNLSDLAELLAVFGSTCL